MLCEQILRDAFGSVGEAPADVLELMRDTGRIVLYSPEVPVDAPLGLLREVFRETLDEHPYVLEGARDVREEDKKKADQAQAASTERVGVDLIVGYNRGKTDPSQLASYGHANGTGYEFSLERDGVTFTVQVRRDLGD